MGTAGIIVVLCGILVHIVFIYCELEEINKSIKAKGQDISHELHKMNEIKKTLEKRR